MLRKVLPKTIESLGSVQSSMGRDIFLKQFGGCEMDHYHPFFVAVWDEYLYWRNRVPSDSDIRRDLSRQRLAAERHQAATRRLTQQIEWQGRALAEFGSITSPHQIYDEESEEQERRRARRNNAHYARIMRRHRMHHSDTQLSGDRLSEDIPVRSVRPPLRIRTQDLEGEGESAIQSSGDEGSAVTASFPVNLGPGPENVQRQSQEPVQQPRAPPIAQNDLADTQPLLPTPGGVWRPQTTERRNAIAQNEVPILNPPRLLMGDMETVDVTLIGPAFPGETVPVNFRRSNPIEQLQALVEVPSTMSPVPAGEERPARAEVPRRMNVGDAFTVVRLSSWSQRRAWRQLHSDVP